MADASWEGRRALVLGAGGFVGRNVARELVARGARLSSCVRDARSFERIRTGWGLDGDVVELDLERPGAAAELVAETRPDVAFCLAGYGVDRTERDEELARRLNTELVEELALACAAHQGPGDALALVHVGSALEFGSVDGDLSDPWRCEPTTTYGRTKLEGSLRLARAVRERGLRAVVARLFTVYGPGEHEGRLLPSLLAARAGSAPLPLTAGTQRRDFTYVGDVARGLVELALAGTGGGEPALNLATGRLTDVRAFTERAAAALGIDPARLQFGALPTRPEEMNHEPVAVARCRERLGWVPSTPIEDGVARTRDFALALG